MALNYRVLPQARVFIGIGVTAEVGVDVVSMPSRLSPSLA
jgi:hypothetical protein